MAARRPVGAAEGRAVWRRVARFGGVEVKSSALTGAGRETCWAGSFKWKRSEESKGTQKKRRGRSLGGGCGPLPLLSSSRFSSVSPPHSAVASQLVSRGTWRHLVSVSTGAGTAEGCVRLSSAPVAGEETAEARLQDETDAVTPESEETAAGSGAMFSFF